MTLTFTPLQVLGILSSLAIAWLLHKIERDTSAFGINSAFYFAGLLIITGAWIGVAIGRFF